MGALKPGGIARVPNIIVVGKKGGGISCGGEVERTYMEIREGATPGGTYSEAPALRMKSLVYILV